MHPEKHYSLVETTLRHFKLVLEQEPDESPYVAVYTGGPTGRDTYVGWVAYVGGGWDAELDDVHHLACWFEGGESEMGELVNALKQVGCDVTWDEDVWEEWEFLNEG